MVGSLPRIAHAAALLPVHGVTSVNRDIAIVDNGAYGVDALVFIGAERAIGYRFIVGYILAKIVNAIQSFGFGVKLACV